MRRILQSLALLACLASAGGCMVLDEIDNAAAKMPATAKKGADADSQAAATSPASTRTQELLQQSKVWWEGATSLSPEGVDTSIVSCRLEGSTHFMSRDDCLSRGGVVGAG